MMSLRILAVILAGASMRIVSPPVGLYEIHWFNLVPAFWAMHAGDNKKNGWLMYLFGVSLLGFNYNWVSESVLTFSNLPDIVAWGCVALYALAFAIPFWWVGWSVHWCRERFGMGWLWLVPGLQVAIEQTWPALFPYYHGALFYRSDITWQFASIFGVTSLTYLIFLTNALGTEFFFGRRDKDAPVFHKHHIYALVIILFHLGFGYWRRGAVEQTLSEAPTIDVAIMQQNVTMTHRLSRSPWVAIRDWGKQTMSILDQNPDLVVWPEGALGGPINPDDDRPAKALGGRSLKEFFSELSDEHDFHFLIGGGTINFHDELDADGFPTYTAYNSCYLFDDGGDITGRYDKMVPLPFGEYIPFAETFPILRKWIRGPGNFRAGKEVTYFNAKTDSLDYTFSTPICYEAILNYQMHKMSDADLFINITNDAWFGKTAAPHQHAMLTTVQAIEWGRPLFRLAYTGVSFVVEPHGQILYETKPFEEVSRVEPIRMGQINTIYRQGGWIFPWLWVTFWGWTFGWMVVERRSLRIFRD